MCLTEKQAETDKLFYRVIYLEGALLIRNMAISESKLWAKVISLLAPKAHSCSMVMERSEQKSRKSLMLKKRKFGVLYHL